MLHTPLHTVDFCDEGGKLEKLETNPRGIGEKQLLQQTLLKFSAASDAITVVGSLGLCLIS